jgi:hypothetical protein
MQDEKCPWLLLDGFFIKTDSEFLEQHIMRRAQELLRASSLDGPLQEFVEARDFLSANNYDEAIAHAQKAFESTMKALLHKSDGTAIQLIRALTTDGFFKGLPETVEKSFGESVLTALPYIGNRMGRHGQGENVIMIPESFTRLAVHLAGSFIVFLLDRKTELDPNKEQKNTQKEAVGDDLPF